MFGNLFAKKNGHPKLVLEIQVEPAEDWDRSDCASMNDFLKSDTGKKLLDTLHYTIYEYMVTTKSLTDETRGIISGISMCIYMMKNGSKLSLPIYDDEDDEDFAE